MEALTCKGISFTYPHTDTPALHEVSLSVEQGEICLLLGLSGAGKTTLLKLLKKEIAPKGILTGMLTVNGFAGYVSQFAEESLITDRVYSNLSFGLTNQGRSEQETALAVADCAAYFGLSHLLRKETAVLSGGEKQRLNLAAVMAMQPNILLLDEPDTQLDETEAERFVNTLRRVNADLNTTMLISGHSERLFEIADTVAVLDGGNLLIKDKKEEVAAFLQSHTYAIRDALSVKYKSFTNKNPKKREKTADSGETVLSVKGLYFAYKQGENVLRGLDYRAEKGRINGIIGANASGKTTLLKCLAGVRKPYRGKIKATGRTAMLCQNIYDLFTADTCEQEVLFGELTDRLGISDLRGRHPYDLSGGQAQRLALCKVLQTGADILLLDEPTNGLDAMLKKQLGELLRELCREGKTVILVTHDLDFAGTYCDNAAFLSEGVMAAQQERFAFFSSLHFYTTSLARISRGAAVSPEDYDEE